MRRIIVLISSDFNPAEKQIIANIWRERNIATTNDNRLTTVVISPATHRPQHGTTAEFALKLAEKQGQDIDELYAQIYAQQYHLPEVADFPPLPQQAKQKPKFNQQRALKQFDKTKQNYRQRFLTRTCHK